MTIPQETPFKIQNVPLGAHRPIRVVCIGAGYSGLMMSIIAEKKMKNHNVDFRVYEKNHDLGGTWLVNRYPGCQCDIPAHNYAYSFAPNPSWRNYYATSAEIQAYMKDVAKAYVCEKFVAYSHTVTSAVWQEQEGKWRLTVESEGHEFIDICDVLINAGGILSNWEWPNIPGIEKFLGKLLHSADWDTSYDWTGKNVALIGIGSSGIQILPKVAEAKHVDFFVRSPTWITPAPGILEPKVGQGPEVDEEYNYAPEELTRFKDDPEYLLEHRRELAEKRIDEFKAHMDDTESKARVNKLFRESMIGRLGESEKGREIAKWLLPEFPVGCRRLTPGPGFLEALVRDNVDSWWNDIDRITEKGIQKKDGTVIELDAIFCATGFNTTFKPQFRLIGRNGVDLAKKWTDDEPMAYFSTTIPDFPNYFAFIGPNSPISNGSLVQAIQMTGVYIYKCINKLQTQSIKSMEVRFDAVQDYDDYVQTWLSKTVWVSPCRSWYKRGTTDGRVVAVYGGSCYHFIEALREPRWEDYKLEYFRGAGKNRFSWLGNGLTVREAEGKKSVGDTQTLNFEDYWDLMVLPEIYY
ncbi:FAD/NAD(P)-binding domain-containing protein [Lindgomyces ingoldianus]|uniref:FAD/NAD(P)-binding domain-containing protein n=1 Tax=Lindgomyces ingoldianus TaxID=673940 RepID=A0ACB6QLM8_9PLEO|nr:FAD/NAD(P)-binding domain-containing protein [Lindgomyces ingoldianus]KAF2467914.1 FAD/NAD(P)-binding domain-containing protein [Lindgomyces ingoldianus]